MFYAVPEMHSPDGKPVNALFGVVKTILNLHQDGFIDALVVAVDGPGKSFRTNEYPLYKATRDRMPDDLRSQIEHIMEFFRIANIPLLMIEWYEADDIIGSIVTGHIASEHRDEYDFVILSSDKDLCQFVSQHVRIYDAMKKKTFRHDDVQERFWVLPSQIVDYLAICWDTSDNIPGIPWFGPKKAQSLLTEYGSLESVYNHIDEITGKTQLILIENKEVAFLSKRLAQIYTELDFSSFHISSAHFSSEPFWTEWIIEFVRNFAFNSLLPDQYKTSLQTFHKKHQEVLLNTDFLFEQFWHHVWSESVIYLSTSWKDRFTLDRVYLLIADIIYICDTSQYDYLVFFQKLLDSSSHLYWYDLKNDIQRIFAYQNNFASPTNTLQSSIF